MIRAVFMSLRKVPLRHLRDPVNGCVSVISHCSGIGAYSELLKARTCSFSREERALQHKKTGRPHYRSRPELYTSEAAKKRQAGDLLSPISCRPAPSHFNPSFQKDSSRASLTAVFDSRDLSNSSDSLACCSGHCRSRSFSS